MAILLGNEIRLLSNASVVNAFSATAQPVYTAPASKKVVLTSLVLRCTAATGVATPCSAKVEINAAAGDIFASEILVGVLVADDTWTFIAEARGIVVPAGGQVDVTITNPATGTSQSLLAEVFGYIIF